MMFFLNNSEPEGTTPTHIVDHLEASAIQIVDSMAAIDGPYLLYKNEQLCMANTQTPKALPVAVDFLKSNIIKRLSMPQVKSELINKTLGKKHNYKTVLDATAGMGMDSMIFSGLGLQVQAFEKSLPIYLLLSDGLKRSKQDRCLIELAGRINLNFGDSLDYLQPVDVAYVDFMFSKEDKKAKSKKNMEIFKLITDVPSESKVLEDFSKLLQLQFKRLVFKRPLKSEVIKMGNYSHSVTGKAIRYDIYLPS